MSNDDFIKRPETPEPCAYWSSPPKPTRPFIDERGITWIGDGVGYVPHARLKREMDIAADWSAMAIARGEQLTEAREAYTALAIEHDALRAQLERVVQAAKALPELGALETAKVLPLRPEDVIVLRLRERIPFSAAERIRRHVSEYIGGKHKVLVLDGGAIEVLRPENE